MAKLILRRAFVGEPQQGWHTTILSEAARYGWQPPVRERQRKDTNVWAVDINTAMDYLINLLPDQYELEVERG